jgi:tetratricopeptide (TPR) repeat protein
MLCEALMPLPLQSSIKAGIASHNGLHSLFTPATIGKVDMMATTNSQPAPRQSLPQRTGFKAAALASLTLHCSLFIALWSSLAMLIPHAFADPDRRPGQTTAARAERIYLEAKARWMTNSTDPEAAWQFGRACFDWAELASGDSKRAEIAEHGIEACRQSIHLNPRLTAGHYYLGLNLGQLARTRALGALKLVSQMETVFKTAIALDPMFDYAGPHRSLGLLYRDAPGWPASIGNRSKARENLRKAVELAPEYPENWLSLLEAYLDWGEKRNLQAALPLAEQALQKAREKLRGEDWTLSWRDWQKRWDKIKIKATEGPAETSRFR